MKESQRLERGRGKGENEGKEIACLLVFLSMLPLPYSQTWCDVWYREGCASVAPGTC